MNLGTPLLLSQYTDYYDAAKAFICKLFGPIGKKLGWDAKDGERQFIFSMLVVILNYKCRKSHNMTLIFSVS